MKWASTNHRYTSKPQLSVIWRRAPSTNLLAAARQALTWTWWETRRDAFTLVTSGAVIDELQRGDSNAAARRLAIIQGMHLLTAQQEAIALANVLAERMSLPVQARADALNIAISACSRAHYLLTWNCTHIANASLRPMIEQCCRESGLTPPVICTPEEILHA